jgi:hypothetical protein
VVERSSQNPADPWVVSGRLGFSLAALVLLSGIATCDGGTLAAGTRADLYVSSAGSDSNDGSESAPFRSILVASKVAKPGTTVHVAAGTYAGGFTTVVSGTASARITYVSEVQYGAKIVGAGTASNESGWWNRGDYVDIKGFEIDGSGAQASSWRFGFYGSGSYTTFQGNKVHDILTDPAAFANASRGGGGAGVEMDNYYGAVFGSVIGNIVYDIGPFGQASGLVHGIYQVESGTVANNVVYNVVGNGVVTWHGARDIQIVNNTIDNARDGGILVGSGDSGASPTSGNYITVANNIVTNSIRGIFETGITGLNNQYINNLLYNNTTSAVRLQNGLTDTGTIRADPKFVDAVGRDYRLQAGSPAIDAGVATPSPSTDLDGHARPMGAAPDIGAYEHAARTIRPLSEGRQTIPNGMGITDQD